MAPQRGNKNAKGNRKIGGRGPRGQGRRITANDFHFEVIPIPYPLNPRVMQASACVRRREKSGIKDQCAREQRR
jgi:hypothetical protein